MKGFLAHEDVRLGPTTLLGSKSCASGPKDTGGTEVTRTEQYAIHRRLDQESIATVANELKELQFSKYLKLLTNFGSNILIFWICDG